MSDPSTDPALRVVERCRTLRAEYEAHNKLEPNRGGEDHDEWYKKYEAWAIVYDDAVDEMLETQATTREGAIALIDEFFQCNGEQVDDDTRELLRNLRNYLKSAKGAASS